MPLLVLASLLGLDALTMLEGSQFSTNQQSMDGERSFFIMAYQDGWYICARKKRTIAMVVDNCPVHPNIQSNLKPITLAFLPPNTTSKCQPCDQGIIQNLKLHYRKHLIMQLLTSVEVGTDFQFNLLDALYLLHLSWHNVPPSTISGCLRHCGFVTPEDNPQNEAGTEVDTDLEETSELLASINNSVNIGDHLNVDQEVVTLEFLSGDDIVSSVQQASTSELDVTCEDNTNSEEPYTPVFVKKLKKQFLLSASSLNNMKQILIILSKWINI